MNFDYYFFDISPCNCLIKIRKRTDHVRNDATWKRRTPFQSLLTTVFVDTTRELKHRRRNPRTTTTGSLISRFVCTTHVRVCEWVVHISTTTAFYMEFRSPENVSKRGVPEALFARSLFLFAKLYTWMTKRMWLHHTELCFLLLLQDNIASVYIANMAAALPQGEIEKT